MFFWAARHGAAMMPRSGYPCVACGSPFLSRLRRTVNGGSRLQHQVHNRAQAAELSGSGLDELADRVGSGWWFLVAITPSVMVPYWFSRR